MHREQRRKPHQEAQAAHRGRPRRRLRRKQLRRRSHPRLRRRRHRSSRRRNSPRSRSRRASRADCAVRGGYLPFMMRMCFSKPASCALTMSIAP
jgi:hypothetical protein